MSSVGHCFWILAGARRLDEQWQLICLTCRPPAPDNSHIIAMRRSQFGLHLIIAVLGVLSWPADLI